MSCCGGNCGCGSGCKCGTGCGGCKMYPDFGETSRTEALIVGLGPERTNYFEGSEMGVGAENDGCNCGADCKCGSDCKCGK